MKRRITDEDIDRLLRAAPRRLPADSAERLLARLARERAPARRWWWLMLPVAAAASVALWWSPAPVPKAGPRDLDTLLALDESLAPGAALLDPVNRELCAELPLAENLFPPETRP